MRFSSSLLAAAGLISTANAAIKGFNYGAQFNNDQAKKLVDFEYEFNAAKQLPGTNGWTSARLYTMVQHGTKNSIIEAIQAAINTKTTLLLGMWASAGQQVIDNEITALKAAIQQYGSAFTDLVVGISVGSEDLYRITPTGIDNKAGPGAQPSDILKYIQQTRDAIKGTPLQGKPIGHVRPLLHHARTMCILTSTHRSIPGPPTSMHRTVLSSLRSTSLVWTHIRTSSHPWRIASAAQANSSSMRTTPQSNPPKANLFGSLRLDGLCLARL